MTYESSRPISRILAILLAVSAIVASPVFGQTTPRTRVVVTDPELKTSKVTPAESALPLLRSKISMALSNPSLRRGSIGLKIVSLDSGEVIYERNADSYFVPASNMKSFTVAAALDKLGPNFQFVTSFYSTSKPEADGTLKGDLIAFGRGDPSISDDFLEGDPYSAIDLIAEKLIASGIKRVEGNIVGDESFFNSDAVPYSWEWNDLQWYYGAEISALSVNDNIAHLIIKPSTPGNACEVSFAPSSSLFRIVNKTRTVERGGKKTLRIVKELGQNIYEISGDVPVRDPGFNGKIAFSEPAQVFADLLKQRLELKGVTVTGRAVSASRKDHDGKPLDTEVLTLIANNYSPPLSFIAEKIMKPSQNLYAELLLRTLGETSDPRSISKTSEDKGKAVVQELLSKAGADADSVVQYDGSGLSRLNLITPNASLLVYKYMDSSPLSEVWRKSLTIGGVDGTLRRRFRNTSAESNVRGKTGTLTQVSALSGYITSKAGERFVFSMISNNLPSKSLRVATIDEIVLLIANYEERTTEILPAGNSKVSEN